MTRRDLVHATAFALAARDLRRARVWPDPAQPFGAGEPMPDAQRGKLARDEADAAVRAWDASEEP